MSPKEFFLLFLLIAISLDLSAQRKHDQLRKTYVRIANDSTKKDSTLLICFKIKDAAIKEYGKTSMEYFRALNNIGAAYNQKEDYKHGGNWLFKAYNEIIRIKKFEEISTLEYIYSNLEVRFLYHSPKLDSAVFFANKYLLLKEKKLADNRAYLNNLVEVATDFHVVFGKEQADRYFNEALNLRQNLFGQRSREIISALDSILLKTKPTDLPYLRAALYGVLDTAYNLTALDSMSKSEQIKMSSWKAQAYSKELMDVALQQYGDTSKKFINGLQRLGFYYSDLYKNNASANYCFEKALSILNSKGQQNTLLTLNVVSDLFSVYLKQSDTVKTAKTEKEFLSLAEKLWGKDIRYALVLSQVGQEYKNLSDNNQGNFMKSEDYLKQALSLINNIEGDTGLNYANVLKNLGGTYITYAKFKDAELTYLKAYQLYRSHNSPELYFICRQLQYTYNYRAELAKSNLWLQKAIEIKELEKDTANSDFLNDLQGIVSNAGELKDWKKGELALKRIEKILSANYKKSDYEYERYRNQLVSFEMFKGNYKGLDTLILYNIKILSDTAYYVQEKEILKSTGDQLNTLSYIYLKQNRPTESKKTIDLAFRKFYLDSIAYYTRLADIMSVLNKRDSAIYSYKQAIKGWEQTDHQSKKFFIASLKIDFASFYMKNKQFIESEKLMEEGLESVKDFMVVNMAGFSEKEKQQFNKTLQENLYKYYSLHTHLYTTEPAISIKAYNYIIQAKGLLFNTGNYLKQAISTSADSSLSNKYLILTKIKKELANTYQSGSDKKSADSLENLAYKLEQEISSNTEIFTKFQSGNKTGFTDIKSKLQPDEAAIEFVEFPYFDGDNQTDSIIYAAFIIKPKSGAPYYVQFDDYKLVRELVKNQGVSGRGLELDEKIIPNDIGKKLHSIIWYPIDKYLSGAKTIYLATDGVTNNVSFNGLQDSIGNYLLDKYTLRFLLSTKDINRNKVKVDFKNTSIALFGGAKYDLTNTNIVSDTLSGDRSLPQGVAGTHGWNYLPNTLKEISNINSILEKKHFNIINYQGAEASEVNFKELSGNKAPGILHIATHGFYFPVAVANEKTVGVYSAAENPLLRTGLIFSSANEAWMGKAVEKGKEDGILTAYELANMDLSHTNLAVLSACETGIGENISGEGVFGLQRAIKLAGVNKMLVSLWPVPDKETSEMMQLFYKGISGGHDIVSSFHFAQVKMRQQYPDKPVLWSGFVLIE